MVWLRSIGMDRWLLEQVERGACVVGVCGGFQLLGNEIVDSDGVESSLPAVRGLGLLPVETRLAREKTTRTLTATTPSGVSFEGYEIHMGVTTIKAAEEPFAVLEDGTRDGVRRPHAIGTYLHGALENRAVMEELLGRPLPDDDVNNKYIQYDRLADWFAEHVEHDLFFREYVD